MTELLCYDASVTIARRGLLGVLLLVGCQQSTPVRSCTVPDTPICTADGWCWESPRPMGQISAIAQVTPDDVWMGGGGGLLVHAECDRWTSVSSGLFDEIDTLFAAATDDEWAFGYGGAEARIRGGKTDVIQEGRQASSKHSWLVTGTASDDVWTVEADYGGQQSDVVHWNDNALPDSQPRGRWFTGIAAASRNDVWLTGVDDGPQRFDGGAWNLVTDSGLSEDARAMTVAPGGAWFVDGRAGSFKHWDGARMNTIATPYEKVDGLWGGGPDDLFAHHENGIVHWNGSDWSTAWDDASHPDLSTRSWIGAGHFVATDFALFHYTGEAFERLDRGGLDGNVSISDVYAAGPRDLWATGSPKVGDEALYHYDGASWSRRRSLSRHGNFTGFSPTDIWLPTDAALLHWDGSDWREFPTPLRLGHDPFIRQSNDIYFSSAAEEIPMIHHWDGARWTSIDTAGLIPFTIWSSGQGDLWFTDQDSKVYRRDGAGPFLKVPVDDPTGAFDRLFYGVGPDDAWLLGSIPTGDPDVLPVDRVLHYENGRFRPVPGFDQIGNAGGFLSLGATDVWIDASNHWDGKSLSKVPLPNGCNGWSATGTQPNDLFATGYGCVIHWDGTAWTQVSVGIGGFVGGPWSFDGEAVLVGSGGEVLRRRKAR